ncbi:SDR family oxidoreductase [Pseudanabaenaceae cyanobacterium LEGE 13415]|nr:SDR family oxidoreductase [Pseudanabaenaceae cyanobacterium LEGE 13415]
MVELANKVAIVTGATSGIGAAVARILDQAGMQLVLTGRRYDRLEQLTRELKQAVFLSGDITEPELPQKLLNLSLQTYGRCDVAFNNAGVQAVGTVETIEIEAVCQMVQVNVEAAFRFAYVVLKHFQSINDGHLINTSSVLGTKVRIAAGAHAGTKYAIEAFSEALRMELANTRVRISCIEPGLVKTELHDYWEIHPTESLNVPQPLQPEDIARYVRFILEQPPHIRIPKLMVLPESHIV